MKHQTTSLDTIECPHCHKSFPITEALQHQFIEPLKNELKKETLEKEQSLTQLAEVLKEREAEIAQEKDGIEKQIAARVQETTAQLKQEVRKETEATVALELKDMRAQLNEKTQKIDEFQKTELALRKRERELEERAKAQDLEVERKLDTERFTAAFGDRALWNILASCAVILYTSPYPYVTNVRLWAHGRSVASQPASLEGGTRFHRDTGHHGPDSLVT